MLHVQDKNFRRCRILAIDYVTQIIYDSGAIQSAPGPSAMRLVRVRRTGIETIKRTRDHKAPEAAAA
jgi:hypothetical protein